METTNKIQIRYEPVQCTHLNTGNILNILMAHHGVIITSMDVLWRVHLIFMGAMDIFCPAFLFLAKSNPDFI